MVSTMVADKGKTGLGVSYDVAADIGKRLKQARDSQKKTTLQIASRIKVREHYLVAIEDGQWDELPRGLNGRGLVRNYARELAVSIPELEPTAVRSAEAIHPYEVLPVTQETNVREVVRSIPRTSVPLQRTNESIARTSKPVREVKAAPSHDSSIVTPDLVNILGINPDILNEDASSSHSKTEDTPVVNADQLIGEMVGSNTFAEEEQTRNSIESDQRHDNREKFENKQHHKKSKRERRKEKRLQEQHTRAAEEPSSHVQQHEHHSSDDDVTPLQLDGNEASVAIKEEFTPVLPHLPDHLENPEPVSEKVVQVSPAPKIQESTTTTVPPPIHVQRKMPSADVSKNQSSSKFMWVAAIGFLVLGCGIYLWLDDARRPAQELLTNVESAEPATISNEAAEENTIPDAVTPLESTMVSENVVPLESDEASLVDVETAGLEATSGEEETAPVVSATENLQPTADVELSAATPVAEAAAGPRTAVLKVLGDVELRIETDGKIFFSGTRSPGEFTVPFKQRAEIFVKDGSKITLNYDGWDHGILGHEGRRRRIVLDASAVN